MIAFESILKENGILDKDKKFKSLKEMINSNEKMETKRWTYEKKKFFLF